MDLPTRRKGPHITTNVLLIRTRGKLSILYAETVHGAQAGAWALDREAVGRYRASGVDRRVGGALHDYAGWSEYRAAVYAKGATLLHLLRLRLGDAAFMRLLRAYYAAHRYGILAPDAFRQALVAAGDEEAVATYDRWVTTDEPVTPAR